MMRRLIGALVTTGLLGVVAGPMTAQSPVPDLTEAGQRVDIPEAGFALTFAEGWTVVVDTSEPPEYTALPVLTATLPGGAACEVGLQDAASWNSLAEWSGTILLRLREYGPIDFESVVLPAGDAVRIDVDLPEEEVIIAQYLLTDGSGFYNLACVAADPPEDRWLSIAETFEFLPVEE